MRKDFAPASVCVSVYVPVFSQCVSEQHGLLVCCAEMVFVSGHLKRIKKMERIIAENGVKSRQMRRK